MLEKDSILKDEGDEEILRQAMENGSSVVCCKCGALVAKDRWLPHRDKWCPMLTDDEDSEEEEVDKNQSKALSDKDKKVETANAPQQKKLILGDELD